MFPDYIFLELNENGFAFVEKCIEEVEKRGKVSSIKLIFIMESS